MKKLISLMVAMLICVAMNAEVIDSGTCGINVRWELSDDYTLTIRGSGAMMDYSVSENIYSPWYSFSYEREILKVVIEDGVTSIGSSAFYGCSSLTSVTIPNSVTSIGSGAFRDCSSLTSVEIPNSVTSIGNWAFAGCSSLTSVTIPNSVTSIGSEAFFGCSGLTSVEIPNSVTSIDDNAFWNCSSLTSVTIPNSVTSIGGCAFSGCSGLTSVEIPNSVTSIDMWAFSGCSGLTSVTIGNSVTIIDYEAFFGCYNLYEVYNLSSLNIEKSSSGNGYVGYYAKAVHISADEPSILSTEDDFILYKNGEEVICLGYNGKQTDITIPNSVTEISYYAFCNCSNLTSVTIPNSVTSIGSEAFVGCSSLTSVEIPNSVTSIGSGAFRGCSSLTSVEIPNSVTSIGSEAFRYCLGLTSVEIPNSVTNIGSEAFRDCYSLTSLYVSWKRPLRINADVLNNVNKTSCTLYVPKGTLSMYASASVWMDFVNIVEYEPEGEEVYLTIKYGDAVFANLQITFENPIVWKIPEGYTKVMLDNEDMTSKVANGKLVIPTVTKNSTLAITFGATSGGKDVNADGSVDTQDVLEIYEYMKTHAKERKDIEEE